MTEILYLLFYLGGLALVVGCIGYLFATREKRNGRTLRQSIREAEKLGGTYGLSELGNILKGVAALEAWGVVIELDLTSVTDDVQMVVVDQGEVELYESSLEPEDIERFRKSVSAVGLSIRPVVANGPYCVNVAGAWPVIADTVKRILKSRYGVGDEETVQAKVFS